MIGKTVHFVGRILILSLTELNITLQILAFKNSFPIPSDTVRMFQLCQE